MHPRDDLLRAYVDQELSLKQADLVKEHLRRCANCSGRFVALQSRANRVSSSIDQLSPTAKEMPRSPQIAYQQFSKVQKEIHPTMLKRRSFWAALGVVAALLVAFSFTPVRTWASGLLSLFRVQQITVISFDPEVAIGNREGIASSEDTIRQLFNDNLEVTEQGKMTKLSDPDDVVKAAGFLPRVPVTDTLLPQYYVKPSMQANFTIDQPTLQTLLDAAGVDVQIPADIDGAVVTLDVPAAVVAVYGDCQVTEESEMLPSGCTALAQMPSPTVNAPAGLDVTKMGEALLQFLGYSEAEAREMSASIDWTTTLILPIPQGEDIAYENVNVDGVQGTFLTENDSNQYFLLWVKDGMLYALQGAGSLENALSLANLR